MLKASMVALEDGDGFHEVHVTCVGRFLVPTSFLAPTTSRNFSRKTALRVRQSPTEGDSPSGLDSPLYLGFFEFVHNARKRGKALLPALLECLLN